MEEIKNPCNGCTSYWNAGRNCDCSSVCEKYQDYKQKLKKKDKYFNQEIKEQFKNNIDKLHMDFLDIYSREEGKLLEEETYVLRKFVDFLKQNV